MENESGRDEMRWGQEQVGIFRRKDTLGRCNFLFWRAFMLRMYVCF
jgi:hypothetical protein